jgi:hypothetical protein
MAAVMVASMDRTAYRRLDRTLHAAETALQEWGALRRGDHAPNGLPGQAPFYSGMHKTWLDAARTDAPHEPHWMPLMVALYCRQTPLVQTFMRLRWQHGRTTDQARARLGMSVRKANDLVREIRESVDKFVVVAM